MEEERGAKVIDWKGFYELENREMPTEESKNGQRKKRYQYHATPYLFDQDRFNKSFSSLIKSIK